MTGRNTGDKIGRTNQIGPGEVPHHSWFRRMFMGCNSLTCSDNGLALTMESEGFRASAYQDSVGVWTIGYGHTGSDVHPGLTITAEEAKALLASDVAWACACVNQMVTVPLSQCQFDALVDLVFNIGVGNFERSTLLQLLNSGEMAAAAEQFVAWDKAGGNVLPGLLKRRQAETALFSTAAVQTQAV